MWVAYGNSKKSGKYAMPMNNRMCDGFIYVIKEGDTLYKIAKEYDLRVIDILRKNPYVNIYNLQIGDELCLPTMPDSSVPGGTAERTYISQEGDTLQDLFDLFHEDFNELAEYNPDLLKLELPSGMMIRYPIRMPRDQ